MKSHKEKIDKLITLERENNLLNHISTSLFNKGETIAEKNLSEYTIWMTNYWVGTFYPIFKINFNEKNEIKNIKTELSLNGKLWTIVLGGLILSFFVFALIIPMIQDFEYLDYTALIILGIYGLLAFGIYWVFKKIYLNETKYLLNDLKIAIGIETKDNIEKIENEKNEWTIKMILFRLFAYPFSIFIILFPIYTILTGGNIVPKVGGAIVLGTLYLITDIKTIIKKKTKANNS
ncbi:hypothetical protein SAMN06265371_106202 [Lutibacter agarilyticus]|uniref:Uncharacterized protein n=1 Tax=Lutibacter agarilyticus TaxID=1109740 RepID=A0A238XND6_9FLAO|nr:hypothetical protein [Lutibacter agarilyticus]SNR60536.1 hypothetical protein SAMN06265371_106202 [Lutibacter agarilyticus]